MIEGDEEEIASQARQYLPRSQAYCERRTTMNQDIYVVVEHLQGRWRIFLT